MDSKPFSLLVANPISNSVVAMCIKSDELCIENDETCIKNDEICI